MYKWFFYVVKDDKIVSCTPRFCPTRKCVQEIKNSFQCSTFSKHDSKKRTWISSHLQLRGFTVIGLAQLDL